MLNPRDLEIRYLVALDAVATEGSFGRAAERLGYTQSAVSQQISALERAVGAPLFDRPGGPRPVALTPLGGMLAEHARDVLARLEAVTTDVRRFQAGITGRLDVGTFQSTSVALLPAILGRLRAERPQLETRLLEDDSDAHLAEQVAQGHLDLTFTVNTFAELELVELFDDPFVVIARPEDVDGGPVPVSRLNSESLIGQQDCSCQRFVDNGLRAVGCDPDYIFRSNDNAAVSAMVRAGMGMAVLPLLAVDRNDSRIAIRPLDPPIPPRRIFLGWHRGHTLAPSAQRFIEIAQEVATELRGREGMSLPMLLPV